MHEHITNLATSIVFACSLPLISLPPCRWPLMISSAYGAVVNFVGMIIFCYFLGGWVLTFQWEKTVHTWVDETVGGYVGIDRGFSKTLGSNLLRIWFCRGMYVFFKRVFLMCWSQGDHQGQSTLFMRIRHCHTCGCDRVCCLAKLWRTKW